MDNKEIIASNQSNGIFVLNCVILLDWNIGVLILASGKLFHDKI